MSKVHITVFIILISVIAVLFFATQGPTLFKATPTPSGSPLPSGSDTFQPIATPQSQQANTQQQKDQTTNQIPPTAGVSKPLAASISATIKTSKGDIQITLFGKDAPNTVNNFMQKATSNYYNGLLFHRVEDWVLQGGDPKGNGTGGGSMPTEINQIPFVIGSLGVARASDIHISNDSQFFITKTDANWLNAQYTNFGIVTKGMDVVNSMKIGDKILQITIN